MTQESHIHKYTEWTKNRLDEMDASLAQFESRISQVPVQAHAKADAAIADIRRRREAFSQWADAKEDQTEAAWAQTKSKLEAEWEGFEDSVETYLEAVKDNTKQIQDTFKARAESQKNSWGQSISRAKHAAETFRSDRKEDLQSAVHKLEDEAHHVENKLKALNSARQDSWSVFRMALSESRGAFDTATEETRTAFSRALMT